MKKINKIFLLLTLLIFLSTYTPSGFNTFPNKENVLFKIKNIEIINNKLISKNEINKKLSHIYGSNILLIKGKDLEKPLKSIDFLKKIEVKKKYPNTVIIKIFETKPVAIVFKNNNKYLLDSLSNLINMNENIDVNNFPNVIGENGEKNFIIFFNSLKKANFPTEKVKNYYFFQIGRWDIQLLNDQMIKFPPNQIINAIDKSVELLNREDFEDYNTIDLRVHGKIVVE